MPITDQDTITVLAVTRVNNGPLSIQGTWKTSTGVDMGTFTYEFADEEDLLRFANEQSDTDLFRQLVTLAINSQGSVRRQFWDGMAGKTYQISTRAKDITPP